MILLTLIDNALSFKILLLTNIRFLYLEGSTDNCIQEKTMVYGSAQTKSGAEWETLGKGHLSIFLLVVIGVTEKKEASISADINSNPVFLLLVYFQHAQKRNW